ncbi:hypothetical protein B0H14DRAFT_3148385 [Mycena olivaceomarginata]|nr:hypothetical protein B0H14DRAFT_3148385 [Mycena olivaceomarginata]
MYETEMNTGRREQALLSSHTVYICIRLVQAWLRTPIQVCPIRETVRDYVTVPPIPSTPANRTSPGVAPSISFSRLREDFWPPSYTGHIFPVSPWLSSGLARTPTPAATTIVASLEDKDLSHLEVPSYLECTTTQIWNIVFAGKTKNCQNIPKITGSRRWHEETKLRWIVVEGHHLYSLQCFFVRRERSDSEEPEHRTQGLTFASVSQRVEDEPEAAASRVNTALHPRADWWSLHAPLFLRGVPPITSILHPAAAAALQRQSAAVVLAVDVELLGIAAISGFKGVGALYCN